MPLLDPTKTGYSLAYPIIGLVSIQINEELTCFPANTS